MTLIDGIDNHDLHTYFEISASVIGWTEREKQYWSSVYDIWFIYRNVVLRCVCARACGSCYSSFVPLDYIIHSEQRKKKSATQQYTRIGTRLHHESDGISVKIGCLFDIPCVVPHDWRSIRITSTSQRSRNNEKVHKINEKKSHSHKIIYWAIRSNRCDSELCVYSMCVVVERSDLAVSFYFDI